MRGDVFIPEFNEAQMCRILYDWSADLWQILQSWHHPTLAIYNSLKIELYLNQDLELNAE